MSGISQAEFEYNEAYGLPKEPVKKEQVNHPDHYNIPGKKECIEQMRSDYGELITAIFCLTNAYKYLYRAGEKEGNSAEQDVAKAKWYFNYQENLSKDILEDDACYLREYVEKELKKYENN